MPYERDLYFDMLIDFIEHIFIRIGATRNANRRRKQKKSTTEAPGEGLNEAGARCDRIRSGIRRR